MKVLITLFLTLFAFEALAKEPMLRESPYRFVKQSIGKGKPYFLEVGSDSCHSCQIMGARLYKVTQEHPFYNIHFINVQKQRSAARELKVMMIPTQIIFDKEGKEVYRHIGTLGKDILSKLFQTYQF